MKIESKEDYQFPAVTKMSQGNVVYYSPDIQQLPHFTEKNLHFLWHDIQFSKGSTTKDRLIQMTIDGRDEMVYYRMAPCRGAKKCSQCEYTLPNRDRM